MANSKYEYVKSFEVEDEVMLPNLIVVRINGRDFRR
jgi:tRNA(His) guanylyltransferase